MTHRISEWGANFIVGEEGFVDRIYADQGGKPTIGFGHLVVAGETFPARITRAEAIAIFQRDLARFDAAIGRLITYPTTQRQHDVLVSLAFNNGAGAIERSRFRRLLNAGDIGIVSRAPDGKPLYTRAMWEWADFNRVDGKVHPDLVVRRAREIAIFYAEHLRRMGATTDAPDLRDPTLSEVNFGKDPNDDDAA